MGIHKCQLDERGSFYLIAPCSTDMLHRRPGEAGSPIFPRHSLPEGASRHLSVELTLFVLSEAP